MSVSPKMTKSAVVAEVSRLTFIQAHLLRPTDKLGKIGINSALKVALGDDLKPNLHGLDIDLDVTAFRKKVKKAKTVNDLVRATARCSRRLVANRSAAKWPDVESTLDNLSDVSRAMAREAVITSIRKQLRWQGAIQEKDKLSKWRYTPIMLAQLAALINNYFRNGVQGKSLKLVPPMALSHIEKAEYVSEIVDAVDEKQTRTAI